MDKHTLDILEFPKILEMASAFSITFPGREAVRNTRPLNDPVDISRKTDLVSECRTLLSEGVPSGIEHFEDLVPLFERIRPADAVLEPFELKSFLPLFYSAFNLKSFENNPACTGLSDIVSGINTHPDLKSTIEVSIDSDDRVSDRASPELATIRRGIRTCENRIKKVLDGILKHKHMAPHLQDFFIAERNNRLVIPVKVDSKGSIPGILHDISNTGETVYIEPYSTQKLGNDLESLRAEEKVEEYRILRDISSLLRESRGEIESDYYVVAVVDDLWSVARFSEQMEMSPSEINSEGIMRINRGRHPLLWKTLRREKRENELMPLDIEIGGEHSSMVITGSNAGGKTVALKTIGAINLMALSGMHVPADSGTTVPLIRNIFADIGDEQSIEHNLSTFSAHITRISEIVRQSDSYTLVIIDELGTGTDPEQGGALSCAILKKLKQNGALTMVSTHLGVLKAFAHSEEGMVNSSMEMKEVVTNGVSTFKPTYKLVVGEPGTSHAFETAESLGLHKEIIDEARATLKGEGARIESLIRDLKHQKSALETNLRDAEELKRKAKQTELRLKEELEDLRMQKQALLSKALAESEEIIKKTKNEAHEMIRGLKKAKASETGKIIKELDNRHKEIKEEMKAHAPEKTRALKEVTSGQRVYISVLGTHGTVSSVNKKIKKYKVVADGKEIMVPFGGLSEPVDGGGQAVKDKQTYTVDTGHIDMDVPNELNVIGKRVDPALSMIERYLNDASMSGLDQVRIIHGIGTGKLSSAIRDFLKDHPLVRDSRTGNEDEGGEAVTIAQL
jgi:DNA mismatch repair protein MutS2